MTIDFSIDDYKQLAEEIAAAGGELGGLLREFVRMTFELTMDNTRAVKDKALEIADLRETCADLRERLESTSKVADAAESTASIFRTLSPRKRENLGGPVYDSFFDQF